MGVSDFYVHAPVQVCGLKTASHHNGKLGSVSVKPAAAGRVLVALNESNQTLSVRPENLKLIPLCDLVCVYLFASAHLFICLCPV